ncbi:MAG: energy transducer TonB [Bacteroidetes bacterium]|nr:energy transducer TonB [Bacteroidota bacterium]
MKLYELKTQQRVVFESSLIAALVIVTLLLRFLNVGGGDRDLDKANIQFEVTKIDLTKQIKRAPPPNRPSVPIASEQENLLGDETIDDTDIDLEEIPPPPPPPAKRDDSGDADIFVAYDTPPDLQGGQNFIKKNLKYPEMARQAGIEGKAIVSVVIDEKGNVITADVLKEDGNVGFGQAAIDVIMKAKFSPARQRDKAVKVRISFPIIFKLRN